MEKLRFNTKLKSRISGGLLLLLIGLLQACSPAKNQLDQATVSVAIHTEQPGQLISERAAGLSYETKELLPNENGQHYFRPDNEPLIRLFKTLGVKHLRIGGNSVDAANIPVPGPEDIHAFFQFARAAGLKVIYSLRLQDGDPESAKQIAKIIHENYSDLIESFAIGNEPGYYKDYDLYVTHWTAIRDAILAVYPDAVFSGPDQNPDAERLQKLVADFGYPKGRLVQLTQHNYPFGCSYQNYRERDVSKLVPVDLDEAMARMLSDSAYSIYAEIQQGMAEATAGTPLSYRLSETNSFWYSGLKGVSDRFGAALWAVDYMRWWTSHGAEGLNFHTGDLTGGEIILPCRYAAFCSVDDGFDVRPVGYALKLFELGGRGRVLPVEVGSVTAEKLAVYANAEADSVIYITLINREFGDAKPRKLAIALDFQLSRKDELRSITLSANNNDVKALASEIDLGGEQIETDGRWNGNWEICSSDDGGEGQIQVEIQPASAIVLQIHRSMKKEIEP